MSTKAVLRCKYCGRPVIVTMLRTTQPDPSTRQLGEFMSNLNKIAICPRCKNKYNYMASQGRSDEFLRGMLSPINLDIGRKK
jgi:hypothetical protein